MECVNIGWNETERRKHAVQDGHNKSQTKKKQSEEKDGKQCTKNIFERAAQIMKNNIQKPPPKVERKNPPVVYSQMGLELKFVKDAPKE